MVTHVAAIGGTLVLIWAGTLHHLSEQASGIASLAAEGNASAAHLLSHFDADRQLYLTGASLLTAAVLAFGAALLHGRLRLIRSQEDLSITLENMAQGIIMVDAQRRVRVISRRASELLGLPDRLSRPGVRFDALRAWQVRAGELAGQVADVAGDTRPLTQADLGGRGHRYERLRPNGIALEVRNELLPDGGAVRTYTDITDRRRAEEQLARARDTAEAASKARASFLAMMSHEIRTPLSGIIGAAGLLLGGRLGPEERGYAEIIQASGKHLLQLIDDTLDFSRLDAGRLELDDAPFDLPAAVTSAAALMTGQAEAKHLRLTTTIAPDVPRHVRGDERRLRQVLINLIGNGVKFTEAGGIDVMVTTAPAEGDKATVKFAVRDSGIGIAPEALTHLFTEFTQADNSISRRFGGSGLGLAISRRLVALMGGTLCAESAPGAGATFRFDVTLALSEAIPEPPPTPRLAPCRPLAVLLAEDNPTNQLIARRLLERQGHHVDTAADGSEALRAARAGSYDMILMDVMMPGMDGLAATRAIRALPGPRGRVAIIGLTASATPDDETRCRAAGMTGFIAKPVSAEKLAETIHAAGIPAPLDPPLQDLPLLDMRHLDALRDEIGAAALEPILAGFLGEAQSYIDNIAQASGTGSPALARHCHLLTGVARNMGLSRMGAIAARLEATAQGGTDLPALRAELDEIAARSLDALQAYRAELAIPAA